MKALYLYAVAFVFFWIGFLTSSLLWAGRDKHAATMGDMEREAERKHGEGVSQDPNPKDQTLVVGEILERKRTPSRRAPKVKA